MVLEGLNRQFSYILRNGDFKLVANLEYRAPLFGNLEGALFFDAGNVWLVGFQDIIKRSDYSTEEDYLSSKYVVDLMELNATDFLNDIALGTGIGLRYDLGFLVVRLDWGVALHFPYDTGKSGYFNINRFKDAHTLHFAIGYPF
jgi:outer membrane protein assembly factor BamA